MDRISPDRRDVAYFIMARTMNSIMKAMIKSLISSNISVQTQNWHWLVSNVKGYRNRVRLFQTTSIMNMILNHHRYKSIGNCIVTHPYESIVIGLSVQYINLPYQLVLPSTAGAQPMASVIVEFASRCSQAPPSYSPKEASHLNYTLVI